VVRAEQVRVELVRVELVRVELVRVELVLVELVWAEPVLVAVVLAWHCTALAGSKRIGLDRRRTCNRLATKDCKSNKSHGSCNSKLLQ
jgi:hypothetical protein